MNKEVEIELKRLESQETQIFKLAKRMHKKGTFHLDFLANAVLNRSLHLIFGFTHLIRDENYIAASHLVRCHLDNILRFSAAWLVENPHEFARQIMKGTQVDKLKDRNGKKLKDWYLCEILNKEYPWITNVYKTSSDFIHLSHKHIFTSSILKDKNNALIEFRISKKDNYVPDESRIEAIKCMIEITNILFDYIKNWIWTKDNPGKPRQ